MKMKHRSEKKILPVGKLSKIRSQPGMSNAYKNKGVKKFAGANHTYPIQDLSHARNALSKAHFSKDPSSIKAKVYKAYPGLKKRKQKRES